MADSADDPRVEDVLRAATFDVVVGGYDRRQVDVFVECFQARVGEYQEEVAELERLLGSLLQLLRERAAPSYAGLGRRARLLLELAEEEAAAITAAAEEQADAIRAAARRDAERVQADLDRQRAELNARLARLDVVAESPGIVADAPVLITAESAVRVGPRS